MLPIPTRRLSDGRSIPVLGFGTYPMDDAQAETAVATALDLGYRLIDTASLYGNEVGVGRGIARSGVDRSEIIVTTKLRGADHGFSEAIAGLHGSLARLDLDYVDLYLIHWPLPRVNKYVDAWRAMIHLRDEGLIRSIGVSNFNDAPPRTVAERDGRNSPPSIRSNFTRPGRSRTFAKSTPATTSSPRAGARSVAACRSRATCPLPSQQSATPRPRLRLCFAGTFNRAHCPFPRRPPSNTNERTSMSLVSNSPARRWPRLPPSIKPAWMKTPRSSRSSKTPNSGNEDDFSVGVTAHQLTMRRLNLRQGVGRGNDNAQ